MWEELKQMFNNVVKKKVKKKKRCIGYKDQWDINYSRKKREVKRKNGKETEKKYLEKKKEFRELLEKKQKEKREEEEQELKKLKREADVWKYINRKRNKKIWKENNIKDEEWRKYFKELLDGIEVDENKVQQSIDQLSKLEEEKEDINKEGSEEKGGLKTEETNKALCKMKKKKATGIDDVPMEAYMQVRIYVRS